MKARCSVQLGGRTARWTVLGASLPLVFACFTVSGVSLAQTPQGVAGDPGAAPEPSAADPAKPLAATRAPVDALLELRSPATRVLHSWPEAVRLLRANSAERTVAVARIAQAEAQLDAAYSRLHPELSVAGAVQQHLLRGRGTNVTSDGVALDVAIPDPSRLWTARLSVRQPLLALANWREVDSASEAKHVFEARAREVQRRALAVLADAIVLVVTEERLAEVNRVALRSALTSLSLTQRGTELGSSATIDLLRAQQEVALYRTQVVRADEAVMRSREALGAALGRPEAWGLIGEFQLDDVAQAVASSCTSISSILERSDVQAARADVAFAASQRSIPNWRRLPRVDLLSDVAYDTAPVTANGRAVQWTVGAVLQVPLYDGGLVSAEVRKNDAQLRSADALLTETKTSAQHEIADSLRAVSVALQDLSLSREMCALAGETSRLSELAFRHGTATSFELADSARRYHQAELDVAIKESEVVRARVASTLALANCEL